MDQKRVYAFKGAIVASALNLMRLGVAVELSIFGKMKGQALLEMQAKAQR